MHHRALRHLHTPRNPATISSLGSNFTQALQAAAGRAWLRRVASTPTPSTCGRPCMSNEPVRHKLVAQRRAFSISVRAQYTELCAQAGVDVERESREPGDATLPTATTSTAHYTLSPVEEPHSNLLLDTDRKNKEHEENQRHRLKAKDPYWEFIESYATPVQVTNPLPTISLPRSTTQRSFYKNLRLALTKNPPPKLPVLIDYHDSHPKLRSTKSYNLLIELALRHCHFGTVHWLFEAMNQDSTPQNFTTHKLRIRLLVRTGNWEQAWTQASGLTPEEALDKPLRNGLPPAKTTIPWHWWLELLGNTKRGALRHRRRNQWTTDEEGFCLRLPSINIIKDPLPGTKAHLRRRRLLTCIQPDFGKAGFKTIRPKLIKGVVYGMLRDDHFATACDLAKSYLTRLPGKVSEETVAQCMDIVHVLLSADTQNGLTSLRRNRKVLLSLFQSQPLLKPTATTLFLMLTPLKKTKRCGTLAERIVRQFQKSWGASVVDSRVRRRVALLAEKEGRPDIAQAMFEEEMMSNQQVSNARPTVPNGLARPPDRMLFPKLGTEHVLWQRLKGRICRKRLLGEEEENSSGEDSSGEEEENSSGEEEETSSGEEEEGSSGDVAAKLTPLDT